jgi:chromosomal replication initiation ATPase DnaA
MMLDIEQTHETDNNIIYTNDDCTFDSVIKKFNLNEQQQAAFLLFTRHALDESPPPKRIYIGGEGGTGKTCLIDAIVHYFKVNNIHHKLLTSATTGNAASLVNGLLLFIY